MYKRVVEVALPGLNLFNLFEYRIPEDLAEEVEIGKRVIVSFYRKIYSGVVLKIKSDSDFAFEKLKNIKSVYDDKPIISENLIKLAYWISDYYICSLNKVLGFVIPPSTNIKSKKNIFLLDENLIQKIILSHRNLKYRKIASMIFENKKISYTALQNKFSDYNIDGCLNSFKNQNIIKFVQEVEDNAVKFENKIFLCSDFNYNNYDILKFNSKQKNIIEFVKLYNGEFNSNQIVEKLNCSTSPIKTLIKKKILEIRKIKRKYDLEIGFSETEKNITLNEEQKKVCDKIFKAVELDCYKSFLLYGITGSGKTEIYLQAIHKILEKNGDCIMLVPEISLTPQTVARFKNRFGEKISVLHSMLSNDERREQWQKILNGETKIVVGARSAIFAPFKNLKLIIVDEEHETSYKQSESPTYNGRDVAVYRAFLENCPVILGSATPTIESFYNAENQKYELLKLTKRANENAKIPKVKICDIKSEIANYDKSLFSSELKKNIDQALINKQQIILFLNRRGFSPVMICLSCGAEFKCPDCNVALTFHYNEQKAICHYCGYEIFVEGKCPECHQNTLKFIGSGTEKIELASKYNFPDAIVKRVDADTVRKKNYLNDVLTKFKNKDIDILVGTQILAKGLDFPEVTVVGVILADITLNLPDFRAAERTFSLLTQVAGRAGRSIFQGNVVIQTLKPKNYAIQSSVTQDYIKFYNYEISLRKKYGYPPFNKLINIVFSGETENEVKYFSKLLVESLTKYKSNLKILGPVPAAIPYLRKKYRYHILIKGNKLLFFKRLILEFFKNMNSKKTKMFIDVDPISIM